MRVECVPIEGRRLHFNLIVEGEVWKTVHTSIFGKRPSLGKNCESRHDLEKAFAALEFQQAKLYAMNRLAAMNLPSTTLVRSLKQRLVSEETIERVIESLQAVGYLNDEEWKAGFIRRLAGRKLGPRAIAQKLQAKGFDREGVKDSLESQVELLSDNSQRAAIKELLKTRFAKRNFKDFKEKQKVCASLARRGFDYSLILEELQRL